MKLIGNHRKPDKTEELARQCAVALRNRYGDGEKWAATFNPSRQAEVARNIPAVFSDTTTPSLVRSAYAFGRNKVETWLSLQLATIVAVEGERTTVTPESLMGIARDLLSVPDFRTLRPTDIMLFCVQFRTGQYGKIYGRLNTMDICAALREFCRWRQMQLDRAERERERQQRLEHEKTAITWEQYCAIKGLTPDDNPLKLKPE